MEAFDRGRAKWPEIAVDPETFRAHLAEHAVSDAANLHAEDLYLVLGAAAGNNDAIRAVEDLYLRPVAATLPEIESDELVQRVRYRLLAEKPPRILQYAGRGPLKGWLRVVLVREGLMALREKKREVDLDEADALIAEDHEIAHMKTLYGAKFKAAFAQAFAALEPLERNLLRYHYLDGLGFEEIAAMRRVHRTTITRMFQRIRDQLFRGTREAMMREVSASETELDSIMRLIESQLDVSLHRLLSSPE